MSALLQSVWAARVNPLRPAIPPEGGGMRREGERAFTLVELIVFIVIAGAILPLIFIYFMTALKSYSTPEIVSRATFLGEELMEEIKSKRFNENASSSSRLLGSGNENSSEYSEHSEYNDVDDYDGYNDHVDLNTLPKTLSGIGGYSRSVIVFYVDESNLDVDAGAITPFKRIQVTVSHKEIPDIKLVTLVSR